MFLLAFIVIALPVAIASIIAILIAKKLKLVAAGMGRALLLPTIGLAAGGFIMGFMVEEFVIRPIQLQDELLGGQWVTPLSLRSYAAWGMFGDPGTIWTYSIDTDLAAQLAHRCRVDPLFARRACASVSDGGRDAFIRIEGTTLTILESFS
jgi:hypothetical protein